MTENHGPEENRLDECIDGVGFEVSAPSWRCHETFSAPNLDKSEDSSRSWCALSRGLASSCRRFPLRAPTMPRIWSGTTRAPPRGSGDVTWPWSLETVALSWFIAVGSARIRAVWRRGGAIGVAFAGGLMATSVLMPSRGGRQQVPGRLAGPRRGLRWSSLALCAWGLQCLRGGVGCASSSVGARA